MPIGVAETDLTPVYLDLGGPDPHLVIFGDGESGKTTLLRAFIRGLTARQPPARAKLLVVEGVGRYRGGVTAVPDFNGELQPVGLSAWMFGYEHYWSDRLSSNGVYSVASSADKDYYSAEFNKDLDYGAVNLIYWFLPNRAWAGVEYLYGRRQVFDGGVGRADRFQFAIRFNLP